MMLKDEQLGDWYNLLEKVKKESERQISKWGIQNITPFEWSNFLGEEYGELCQAISENFYRSGTKYDVIKEAIQVATLALKIAEMYDQQVE